MMTHCSDPREAIELLVLRERMREWRFYDHLRTDRDAPARKPQVGTYTPVLAGDGSDLAAAVQTIREIGAAGEMDEAIADAFPGAHVEVAGAGAYLEIRMRQHGLLRPLGASELSDGTLRYLLLVAALVSRLPAWALRASVERPSQPLRRRGGYSQRSSRALPLAGSAITRPSRVRHEPAIQSLPKRSSTFCTG
jgi:predicted ATPase